jgi:hypothetical protein
MSQIRFFEDPEFFRRQTLFQTLAWVLVLLTFFAPVFQIEAAGNSVLEITGWAQSGELAKISPKTNWLFLQTVFLFAALSLILITVFSYKKRSRQIMLSRLACSALIVAPTMGLAGALVYTEDKLGLVSMAPSYGLAFPFLGIICLLYAERLVRMDIKKIRSMDRFW